MQDLETRVTAAAHILTRTLSLTLNGRIHLQYSSKLLRESALKKSHVCRGKSSGRSRSNLA